MTPRTALYGIMCCRVVPYTKKMKKLIIIILAVALGACLMSTRPSADDFSEWYTDKYGNSISVFIDAGIEKLVKDNTEVEKHLFFVTFRLSDDEKYYGFANHFIGNTTIEQVHETIDRLIDLAKQGIDHVSE